MTTKTILRRARKLLEDKAHWTTGAEARDKYGHAVTETSERAVRFCAAGAIGAVAEGRESTKRARVLLDQATPSGISVIPGLSTIALNDRDRTNATHAAVIEAFKRAEKAA